MPFLRIATSELFGRSADATRVRFGWTFADFLDAHVILDIADDERARAKENAGVKDGG